MNLETLRAELRFATQADFLFQCVAVFSDGMDCGPVYCGLFKSNLFVILYAHIETDSKTFLWKLDGCIYSVVQTKVIRGVTIHNERGF